MANGMCRIPITARYAIIDGKAVMTDAEWVDISGEDIAKFLIEKLGPGFWEKKSGQQLDD